MSGPPPEVSHVAYCLVMEAVDLEFSRAECVGEMALGLDLQPMHESVARLSVMRLGCGALDLQVLPQRA